MTQDLLQIEEKYIPLDKSWIIRMGVLDLVNGYDDIEKFLSSRKSLGDDLLALKNVAREWKTSSTIDVGESGTLYRLLKFTSWKLNLNKKFVKRGTLTQRKITDDPEIVNRPQSELLKLDNGTSQWASAAALLGDIERVVNPPYKLELTYQAIEHWKNQRDHKLAWTPKYDITIQKQAETFLKLLHKLSVKFVPQQAEDFCFAYIFNYITTEEGEKLWPALRGHESDRIIEIQEALKLAQEGKEIASKDHRVVQAIAMWAKLNDKKLIFLYPESVNKSWPQFWDFLNDKTAQ